MPRLPSWLTRLHLIRRSVQGTHRSHYDRRDLELLLGIGARAAGELMQNVLPTVRWRQGLLVERDALSGVLDRIRDADNVVALFTKLRADKEAASRKRPRTLIREEHLGAGFASLPSTVALAPGRLEVSFDSVHELVEALAILVSNLDNDTGWFEFVRRYEPEQPVSPAAAEARAIVEETERLRLEWKRLHPDHPASRPGLDEENRPTR